MRLWLCLVCTWLTARTWTAAGQELRFPDELGHQTRIPQPSAPRVECDPLESYCERVTNYPRRIIGRRVNASAFNQFARRRTGFSILESRRRPAGGDSDERRVCEVRRELVFPKAAKDKDGVWRFLVNDDDRFRQPVAVEKCRNKDGPCTAIQDDLSPGLKTRCAQKYVNRLMMAFDENSLETFSSDFRFPAACVCYVRNRFYPSDHP